MPLYDFHCECGYAEEQLVDQSVHTIACPVCNGSMARQFPTRVRVVTGREYHLHMPTLAQQFAKRPKELKILMARARARGINASPHDTYDGSITKGALDPVGIVPHDDPQGYTNREFRKRSDERLRAFDAEQLQTGPPIAPKVVKNLMRQRIRANPDLAASPQSLKKLRDDVINRHAPES